MTMPAAPADIEAYCVKCKASRKMSEAQIVSTKNGKPAAKGKCPVCGTTMMKFLSAKSGLVPPASTPTTPAV